MIADSFFEQGFQHEVCEDFALDGNDYVVISDGCSNGGGPRIHTDFGSRIIAKAAEEHINEKSPVKFIQGVGATAKTQQRMFPNLPASCLTATLMALREFPEGPNALVVGDGVTGCKLGSIWTISIIEYLRGGTRNASAPNYLKYDIFNEVEDYKREFGGRYKVSTYCGELMHPELEVGDQIPEIKEREKFFQERLDFTEKEYDYNPFHTFQYPSDAELAFVISDGAQAFYTPVKTRLQKYNHNIFCLDVLRILLDFPQYRPGFVRTARNWAFKQDKTGTFKRRNWLTGDDVSLGALYRG